jgi:Protein of unknown function (DUF2750)
MSAMQDRATTDAAARRFFERIREAGEVWGLRDPTDEGWATCPSNDSEGKTVMLFWSDRAYAARCARDDWAHYVPSAIPLEMFVDAWLPGMASEDFLMGPNWDGDLRGIELTPGEAAGRLGGADA